MGCLLAAWLLLPLAATGACQQQQVAICISATISFRPSAPRRYMLVSKHKAS